MAGTQDDRREFRRLVLAQDVFAQRFVLRVIGQRLQAQILGDALLLLHAVHAGRGGVDEPPHAGVPCGLDQRAKSIVVDRLAQRRIKFETGIVRDARQMDHGIAAGHAPPDHVAVPQVAANDLQSGVIADVVQDLLAKQEQVQHAHAVACRSSFGTSTAPTYPAPPVTKTRSPCSSSKAMCGRFHFNRDST